MVELEPLAFPLYPPLCAVFGLEACHPAPYSFMLAGATQWKASAASGERVRFSRLSARRLLGKALEFCWCQEPARMVCRLQFRDQTSNSSRLAAGTGSHRLVSWLSAGKRRGGVLDPSARAWKWLALQLAQVQGSGKGRSALGCLRRCPMNSKREFLPGCLWRGQVLLPEPQT